jgi:hypothetical protein
VGRLIGRNSDSPVIVVNYVLDGDVVVFEVGALDERTDSLRLERDRARRRT